MTKHLSVLTLALGLAMAAPLSAGAQDNDTFTRGVAAYENGDYERAAKLWGPLADDGEAEAQRNLAQLYRLGLGVRKDNERAYELYVAAAEQNSVDAQVNAAFLLLTGEGVEKDSKQAALWFAKAADQGDALAQFNLGLMYEKGVGVPEDRDIARELYQLSANQGQKRALARLDDLEGDMPPDGGTTARRAQQEAAAKAEAEEAAELKREREAAEVERAKERARARAEAEKSPQVEKAEVEARTGPILMIEKIEKDQYLDTETPAQDDAAIEAVKNVEAAFSKSKTDAPEATPPARRKPSEMAAARPQAPMATPMPASPPPGMQMVPAPQGTMIPVPYGTPAPAPYGGMVPVQRTTIIVSPYVTAALPPAPRAVAPRMQQMHNAEAAYERGDFSACAQLLMPLANDGMPIAQFLLGRMFNRGEGVELDHFEAYNLWRSAAANGSQQAATALANFSTRFAPSELAKAEANYQDLQRWLAQNGN